MKTFLAITLGVIVGSTVSIALHVFVAKDPLTLEVILTSVFSTLFGLGGAMWYVKYKQRKAAKRAM